MKTAMPPCGRNGLLNHPFVREQSLHFAKLLLADPKAKDANRVALGYRSALGREPLVAE